MLLPRDLPELEICLFKVSALPWSVSMTCACCCKLVVKATGVPHYSSSVTFTRFAGRYAGDISRWICEAEKGCDSRWVWDSNESIASALWWCGIENVIGGKCFLLFWCRVLLFVNVTELFYAALRKISVLRFIYSHYCLWQKSYFTYFLYNIAIEKNAW